MQSYPADKGGASIAYSPVAYPYFFIDTNANGEADPDEVNADNKYVAWTPNLLRAAYDLPPDAAMPEELAASELMADGSAIGSAAGEPAVSARPAEPGPIDPTSTSVSE